MSIQVTAAGPISPIPLRWHGAGAALFLPPSVLAMPSPGAQLEYTVEVCDRAPDAFLLDSTWSKATWFPLDPTKINIGGPMNETINGLVAAIRVNITAYTSGTLSFAVVQQQ